MAQAWPRVLEDLLSERRSALVGYAYVFTGDVSSAEDVVHDAVVRTFSRPRNINSVPDAEAYVRRAIATTFLNAATRRRRFAERAHLLVAPAEAPGPDHAVGERDAAHAALLTLSPRERACVALRFYEDLSVAEIGQTLGISDGGVKRYLSDGIGKLREILGPNAVPEPVTEGRTVVVSGHERSRRAR